MDRIDGQWLAKGGRTNGAHPLHKSRYSVSLARNESEQREAQALRWRVFAEELGARLPTRIPGLDQDIFDPYCEHLIVRDVVSGEVVGTYRMLSPENARRIGCMYSESGFDLTRLQLLRDRTLEIGRSCIHSEYRNGAVISHLWSGLVRYLLAQRCSYLAGCASMGMADGGHAAAAAWRMMESRHLAPTEYRVFPRCALPLAELDDSGSAELPALLKGYLRCGAWVCGEPAWDPDFNTADFFVFLPLHRMNARYARHYLGVNAD